MLKYAEEILNTNRLEPFGSWIAAVSQGGEVTVYMRWLAHTHAMRWHVAHGTVGRGHLYQGRFKAFPIREDEHFPQ